MVAISVQFEKNHPPVWADPHRIEQRGHSIDVSVPIDEQFILSSLNKEVTAYSGNQQFVEHATLLKALSNGLPIPIALSERLTLSSNQSQIIQALPKHLMPTFVDLNTLQKPTALVHTTLAVFIAEPGHRPSKFAVHDIASTLQTPHLRTRFMNDNLEIFGATLRAGRIIVDFDFTDDLLLTAGYC